MELDIEVGSTHRGFAYAEFRDLYGTLCSIQKSSLATDDALWLGVQDPEPKRGPPWTPYRLPDDVTVRTRMHLNREQIAGLIPILQRFMDTGELAQPGAEAANTGNDNG